VKKIKNESKEKRKLEGPENYLKVKHDDHITASGESNEKNRDGRGEKIQAENYLDRKKTRWAEELG